MFFFFFFFFFFFQAEDGIRDKLVTGVHTCALPISRRSAAAVDRVHRQLHARESRARNSPHRAARAVPAGEVRNSGRRQGDRWWRDEAVHARVRSEERRVGKECRSRWSPYQYEKNDM